MLDELGNVIAAMPAGDWRLLGQLRKFAQQGEIRLIVSAFQEVFLAQEQDFAGPLPDYGRERRIHSGHRV